MLLPHALAVLPMLHLVPKQQVVGVLALTKPEPWLQNIPDTEISEHLLQELCDYRPPQLEDIEFEQAYGPEGLALPELEQRLLANLPPVKVARSFSPSGSSHQPRKRQRRDHHLLAPRPSIDPASIKHHAIDTLSTEITPETVRSVYDALLRVAHDPVIDAVPIDVLTHLQRSAFALLHSLASVVLAKLLLLTMTGRRAEKVLFVDTYVVAVISLLEKIVSSDTSTACELLGAIPRCLFDDEPMLAKLEYLVLRHLHLPSNQLATAACRVLVHIFHHYPSQQPFLLHEVLVGFTTNQAVRLPRGGPISTFTNTVLLLVQSFSLDMAGAPAALGHAAHQCHLITDFLLEKATDSDASFRTRLTAFITDLTGLVAFPEWPGAELLLSTFMKSLLDKLHSGASPQLEAYALDTLGVIGLRYFQLRGSHRISVLGSANVPEELHTLKSAFLNTLQYLHLALKRTPSLKHSLRFLLVRYICMVAPLARQALPNKAILGDILAMLEQAINGTLPLNSVASDRDAVSTTSYTAVLLSHEVGPLYDAFLTTVLRSIDNPKIRARTRAVKVLLTLIDHDESLLFSRKVQQAMVDGLADESAAVRDAVLELVARYLTTQKQLVVHFHRPVTKLLFDDGAAVRKRCLKVVESMYHQCDFDARVFMGSQLLRCLEHEHQAYATLVRDTLARLWLGPTVAVAVLGAMPPRLLRGYLTHLASSQLSRVCDAVFDALLAGDDHLRLLAAVVECDGTLLTQDQIVSLQPYLHEADCDSVLEVLHHVLPEVNLRGDVIKLLADHLMVRLSKLLAPQLRHAMPALVLLCEKQGLAKKLANACFSTLRLIAGQPDELRLTRLLHLLGAFASFCPLEPHRAVFEHLLQPNETVVSVVAKTVLLHKDADAGLENVLLICTHHPNLFMTEPVLATLDATITSQAPIVLRGLMEFLVKEDHDAQRRNGHHHKSSAVEALDVAVFHGDTPKYINDGVCAGLIQRYLPQVLDLCVAKEDALLPLQFVQLVLDLGFANPKVCVPTVLVLEGSLNSSVRRLAVSIHKRLYDTHESLTNLSYGEALRLTVEHKRRIDRLFVGTGHLATMYSVVSASYSSKKKFTKAMARVLDIFPRETLQEVLDQRDVVVHVLMNLVHVPFSSYEEVLMLVYAADKFLSHRGLDVTDLIKKYKTGDTAHKQIAFVLGQTVVAVALFRDIIVASHGISLDQIDSFRPGKPDLDLRQTPKVFVPKHLPLGELVLNHLLDDVSGFFGIYVRATREVRDFS